MGRPIYGASEGDSMPRRIQALLLVCICTGSLFAQDLEGIQIHGFATQGFLFSSNNNYLSMKSSEGSLEWTEGAVSFIDSLARKLRVGLRFCCCAYAAPFPVKPHAQFVTQTS